MCQCSKIPKADTEDNEKDEDSVSEHVDIPDDEEDLAANIAITNDDSDDDLELGMMFEPEEHYCYACQWLSTN